MNRKTQARRLDLRPTMSVPAEPPEPAREAQTFAGESLLVRYANLVRLPHTVFALPFALLGVVYASYVAPVTIVKLVLVIVAFTAARVAAKRDIIAFFKQVDGALGELAAVKEEIRTLVERYKQLEADTGTATAPEFDHARPVVHADHIGASTFIEKGWSLISLGDYDGAVQTLAKALQLEGKTADALDEVKQVLTADPNNADAQALKKSLQAQP